MIEFTHIFLGFTSLITGIVIVFSKKGSAKHQRIGRVYVASMFGLNMTSFGIYKLYDGWGFFHWMAIASLIPLIAGMIAIYMKNIVGHYYFMCWSYIGLWCATISEIFVHVPLAVSLLQSVSHIDTFMMVCLTCAGFYYLPKKEKQFIK